MSLITVASNKGGVGKTTLAIELAYALDAVLVDLDHDAGSATGGWPDVGTLAPEWAKRWLTDGDGPGPRIVTRPGLPDLVPAHPDYNELSVEAVAISDRLVSFARKLPNRQIVLDCHPGFADLSVAAMHAADLVVVPVLLQERELRSFQALVREFAGYNLASVPYRVPRWGEYQQSSVAPLHERWLAIAKEANVFVGPTVSEWREWPRRKSQRALLAAARTGEWSAAARAELQAVASWVDEVITARV